MKLLTADASSYTPATTPATAAPAAAARMIGFDVLRIVAIIAVATIHVTAGYLDAPSRYYGTTIWWSADILNSLSRWCVPVFIMLSGAFVLTYRDRMTTRQFFRKRLLRIFLPFVVWSAAYLIWQVRMGFIVIHTPGDLLPYTLSGPAEFHLWFFYVLLGLYLVTPILSLLIQSHHNAVLWFLVILGVVQNIILPTITYVSHVSLYVAIPTETSLLYYFVLGWLLRERRFSWTEQTVLYGLGAAAIALTAIMTTAINSRRAPFDQFWLQYEGGTVLLTSLAVFVAAQAIPYHRLLRRAWMQRLVTRLAGAVFGIYLVHVAILYYVETYGWRLVDLRSLAPAALMLTILGATLAISAVIVLVVQQIPIVRYLVP